MTKLKLDESKIRKGKPIGLPYVGSKKKISKKIVEIIKQNFGTDKTIYDLFGGGGAITFECLINGLDVVYNDIDLLIGQAIQLVIDSDRDFLKELIISRDEFYAIKLKEDKTPEDKLKLLVNSFGNNERSYLYSRKYSDAKYVLAMEIIQKHDCFSGYKQTSTFRDVVDKVPELHRIEVLERLEQILQLQNTTSINDFTVNNNSYEHYSDITDSILYLDPEYKSSTQKMYSADRLNVEKFYQWCIELSKSNIVLISEYDMPEEFKCVFEFNKTKSKFKGSSKSKKYEKLFMVR